MARRDNQGISDRDDRVHPDHVAVHGHNLFWLQQHDDVASRTREGDHGKERRRKSARREGPSDDRSEVEDRRRSSDR